ncbi:MAG TPA: hypothetical protein VKM93_21250 [Terriglobia bacterium]|nr:hypothetical protein [Terriglobia bacterium]
MSVNENQPHVWVLPEDDANRQLANEFHQWVPWDRQRQMQVLRVARGWNKVLRLFQSVHVAEMKRCAYRLMVLLIDFDGSEERLVEAKATIPVDLADRVFILGVWSEPEALRQAKLGSYADIGKAMARGCREGTDRIWAHELLKHNASELGRLREHVRPILFPPN